MKRLALFLVVCVYSTTLLSQNNITNTLGTGGLFSIKDANANYLTVTQSTGEVNILKGLRLEVTGNSLTTGVIFKGADRFIHDFYPTGSYGRNTFIGINSGNFTMPFSNGDDASYNTGIGYGTLTSLTTGYGNTASGYMSLHINTTGYFNTASGFGSLYSNTTGTKNTASGYQSLSSNTTGSENTASGYQSLGFNTTGNNNTASGYQSLYSNQTGIANTATGSQSLYYNTIGEFNSASGSSSLHSNTTGKYNTAVGYASLYYNTTGDNNTASGSNSLKSNTTGYSNTASGVNALYSNTEGFYNTALGRGTGSTITTGNNLTCLGYDAEPTSATATNQITLGNGSISSLRCNVQNISSLSDARDKKNITDLDLGIDFLMQLKPRLFNWDKREWYNNNKSDGSKIKEEPTAGFIAQELDEAQTSENAEWLNLVLKDNPEKLEATPGNLLPIMVKAIQDLKKENDELKTTTIELTVRLTRFEQMQDMLVAEIEKLKTNNNETTKVSLGEK